jgi:hypothetical protein
MISLKNLKCALATIRWAWCGGGEEVWCSVWREGGVVEGMQWWKEDGVVEGRRCGGDVWNQGYGRFVFLEVCLWRLD